LKDHTNCAACGSDTLLQVHHKKPFHLDPSLELNPTNFIVLCMSKKECHLKIGHGGSFHTYNPHVERDATEVLMDKGARMRVEMEAERDRKPL
jgi:5-methylcytosine-specific restriction endonuclease McrA